MVHDLVASVVPLDEHEAQDRATTLRWVRKRGCGCSPEAMSMRARTHAPRCCGRRPRNCGSTGEFHPQFGDDPLFLTVTRTRGEHSHTDVTLWFVLAADQDMRIQADPREANEVRWFALDDPAQWAHDRFDPHMARFRSKLLARLGTPVLVG